MTKCNNLCSLTWALILQFLPKIYELGRSPSAGSMLQHILDDTAKAITSELTEEIQVEQKICLSLKHYTCLNIYCICWKHLLQCVVENGVCHCSVLRGVFVCDFLGRSRLRPCCSLHSPPALGSSRGQVWMSNWPVAWPTKHDRLPILSRA